MKNINGMKISTAWLKTLLVACSFLLAAASSTASVMMDMDFRGAEHRHAVWSHEFDNRVLYTPAVNRWSGHRGTGFKFRLQDSGYFSNSVWGALSAYFPVPRTKHPKPTTFNVAEPSSIALLALGIVGLGLCRRKNQQK